MALNADEKKLLDELTARANAPDDDDDFEVELYDTNAGKGARVPYKSAKGWLHDMFGIGETPAAPSAGDGSGAGGGAPAAGSGDPATPPAATGGYFGRQRS